MNDFMMNLCWNFIERGVLVEKQRESPVPPGLVATTVTFLNSGFFIQFSECILIINVDIISKQNGEALQKHVLTPPDPISLSGVSVVLFVIK